MARFATTAFAAAAVALVGLMPAFSIEAAAGKKKFQIENSHEGHGNREKHRRYEGHVKREKPDKQFRNREKHGNGPSFGILEGGPRLMIVIEPKRVGPPVVKGKNNCEHLKRQIAAGERRLAQMNERIDMLLGEYRVKRVNSTRADANYTADAALKLDQDAKDMERALKKLRKKLKACEAAQWS